MKYLLFLILLTGCGGFGSSSRSNSNFNTAPVSSAVQGVPGQITSTPPAVKPVYTLSIAAGNNQSGQTYKVFPIDLSVTVMDQAGNLVDGIPVMFTGAAIGLGSGTTGQGPGTAYVGCAPLYLGTTFVTATAASPCFPGNGIATVTFTIFGTP